MSDLLITLAALACAAALVAATAWLISGMRATGRDDQRHHGTSGSLGNAFLEAQALLEPEKRHVLEERLTEKREDGEPGAPPQPRDTGTPPAGR